ncbi:MAG: protein translocase subunit yidC [Acidobacteriales bacterium]|nr:protein translocase subunit yidC [Terriglobales bacterium]
MSEIKNPNQDPNDFRRLLLVFALTFVAIIISQQFMSKYAPKRTEQKPQPAATQPQSPTAQAPASSTSAQTSAAPAKSVSASKQTGAKPATPVTIKQASNETDTTIENDLYKITFTNRGALVKSWILKKHQDDQGKPLDMVNSRAAAQYGYPLSLFTYDEALRNKLNTALYVPSATGLLAAPAQVAFEYSDGDTTARKTFSFDHNYVVHVNTSVQHNGTEVQAYPVWPAGFGDQINGPSYAAARIEYYQGEKVERHPAQESTGLPIIGGKKSISNGNTLAGPFQWAGVVDQYFASIFLPDDPNSASLVTLHNTISQNPNEPDADKKRREVFSVLGTAVGNAGGPTSLRLFVGPKNLEVLQSVRASVPGNAGSQTAPTGPGLDTLIDFGMFAIIAKPLFLWLNWTQQHWVNNWGWSIFILTVIINLALFPMRYSGMKSALLQQKIAPELKQINKRYQGLKLTDPRQHDKQKEIQAVMEREGINQFGGCLPTVIQLPFLFAFYAMLSTVNELRHAHWLWISDLSSPDPWHILPVVIVITMFIMQRATPMTGMDEQQAKMMQFMMPLMIGAISFTLPAGLGVYWVTGNIIGYLLQLGMNNTRTARDIRAHLEKRAAKKGK